MQFIVDNYHWFGIATFVVIFGWTWLTEGTPKDGDQWMGFIFTFILTTLMAVFWPLCWLFAIAMFIIGGLISLHNKARQW